MLMLAGCSATPETPDREPEPVTVTKKQKVQCGPEPAVDPFNPRPTPPVVLWGHPKGTEIPDAVWVGMKAQHYENISNNLTDLRSRLKQKNRVIQHYQDCITRHNEGAG